ncbi:MAG TPA: OB-fold nucleic acid binding domain-containing protein, partial [Steroidobacteraceae bacterium]|nr:OB-fold nucleic acid binding domain-containing protein [Steroidobacteraceae bacterium]
GMVDDFINRRQDPKGAPVDYLHPKLKTVLAPTYGVILYQEQVMQIAQVLAGYTLGGADLLRRAMGKKDAEEMAQQRSIFVDGAVARGVPARQATHIFDLMEKFAGYGFNKSHSAAYAMLSFQTAYLKANYPAQYMAAVLSADMDRTDKIVTLIDECQTLGLKVQVPDVNSSGYAFRADGQKSIRYGLGAVKGVGRLAVDAIVKERETHGHYRNLEDLCHRTDLQRVNKRVLEALVRSGSFDALGASRAALMEGLAIAMRSGEQTARTQETGQFDLLGLPTFDAPAAPVAAPAVPEWSEAQRLAGERETLGLFLSGHPIAHLERDLGFLCTGRISEYAAEQKPTGGESARWSDARTVSVAGLILEIRRRGMRTSFVLDDRSGRIEVTMNDEVMQRCRELIVKDALVHVEGALRFDDFSDAWRVGARTVQPLDLVRERLARNLVLDWPDAADPSALLPQLERILGPARGGQCTVIIRRRCAAASAALVLPDAWKVRPTRALLEQLTALLGTVRLTYGAPADPRSAALG